MLPEDKLREEVKFLTKSMTAMELEKAIKYLKSLVTPHCVPKRKLLQCGTPVLLPRLQYNEHKNATSLEIAFCLLPGDDLLCQGLAPQVSSALEVLTSVFGMGTGGTPPA